MKMIEVMGPDDTCVGWIPSEYLNLVQQFLDAWEDDTEDTDGELTDLFLEIRKFEH